MGTVGHKHSEETKEKMRQAHKGKKLTDEHREKISEALKRRPPASEETREKISRIHKGKTVSEETRRKMSESAKAKTFSEEHRRKLGEAVKRRVVTEETREKLRQRALEREQGKQIPSEESRRKMSESRKGKKITLTEKWWKAHHERMAKLRGRKQSKEANLKRSKTLKGRVFTEEHRENLSKSGKGKHSGPNSPNYIDGRKSYTVHYSAEFTGYLKKKIRARDGYTCQACSEPARGKRGHIHHIDGDKQNCSMDNLTLICISCHNKIHSYSPDHSDKIVEFRMKLKPEHRPLRARINE